MGFPIVYEEKKVNEHPFWSFMGETGSWWGKSIFMILKHSPIGG